MASGEISVEEKIPQKGSDRPAIKYLNRHVAEEIACKWYDVGIELMNIEDETLLNKMWDQYGSNNEEGSKMMLRKWLERKPDASWIQLIAALKVSRLNETAHNLERLLSMESDIEKSQLHSNKQKADEAPNAIADDDDIDFSEYEDVVVAFTSLMTRLHKKVTASQLQFIKARCLAVTHDGVFRECIKNEADSVDNFFSLLSDHTLHCNWLNIRLVEVIATASGNKKLEDLVSNYRTEIYSRKLQQVLDYIPQHKVKNKYYKEVTKRISKSPDNVTVRELIKYDRPLANKIALILMSVTANCVSITWLVPTDKVYELFLFALTIPKQSREDDFLKIGSWIVYHPQSVLQDLKKTFAMASPLTLLIGYYHGLLSKDINAGLLIEEMYSKKLLSTESEDHIIVSTGHSVYQKNLLLLEYVRHMDAKSFLEFCKVIMNLWPEIGAQIVAVTDRDTMKLQSDITQDVTTEVQVVLQGQYYDPSLVHIAFLCLIDQVSKLLQSCDIKKLVERCEEIMACEEENIKLFSDDQLKKMNECCSILSLLLSLNFFSWSNHSILRRLLVECSAVRLLDEFDSRLDPLQSIASYPIPYFLSNMIPDDTSTHTILAIRSDQALYECTLQYVYDMQSVMMKACDITQHCLQLLAVRSDPTMLYWTIPQCVVDLINKEVPQHSKYLHSKGVLEVHIYTEPLLTTDNDVIGTLAFVADSNRNAREDNYKEMENTVAILKEVIYDQTKEIDKMKAVNVKQPAKEFDQPEAPNVKRRIKVKQLTEELVQAKVKVNQLTEELVQAEVKVNQLTEELVQAEVKVSQLTEERDEARSELLTYKQEIQSLNQRLLEIENNNSSQQGHNTKGECQPVEIATQDKQAVSEVLEEQSTLVTLDEVEQARKKEHTVHCVLHRSEMTCNLCETPEICQSLYDEEFASQFEQFLERDLNTSLASTNNEDISNDKFLDHIVTHFHADNCPSVCSRLWKYCLNNKLFWVIFKYAPEGFLVYSDSRQNAVGTVVKTYFNYRNVNMIGCGSFGNVYKYSDQVAVKEEFKQPLIAGTGYRSPELFQRIMELDHPHVIKVLEYIAGPYDKDKNKCFLSVMYYKNQKDIQKQFTNKKLTCVLDYMKEYRHQEKFIFRNYTVLCRHIFEGLCYLKSKGIIHRDIKPSNILVHQNCACKSPLQCMCTGDGDVTYLLGDMDLLSLEEEGANLTYTYEEWKKMVGHDPAGTRGMKPPESFFRTEKGERMTTHKSDVWSAGVAMMNVLIGKTIDSEIQEKFSKFIEVATEGTKAATKSVTESLKLLKSIMIMFDAVFKQMKKELSNSGLVNNEMNELGVNLQSLKKMLDSGEESLSRSQSFQGGFSDVYKEENPLARMLTTAHMAQTLHWRCILILPHIYNTQLWAVMQKTLDAIGAGIKLVPDQREDATTIVDLLKATPPVDFSDNEIEN